jgi:hypothetical protein
MQAAKRITAIKDDLEYGFFIVIKLYLNTRKNSIVFEKIKLHPYRLREKSNFSAYK